MAIQRRATRSVQVGSVQIGGGAPVSIQSMLSRPSEDSSGNIRQAQELESAGCEILRVAVPDAAAVRLVAKLKETCGLPIVADIHFDHRLALESIAAGADKIRINPGNIGADDRVAAVAKACIARNIPIRVGVNSGSLEPKLLEKYGGPTAEALAESALENARRLERYDAQALVLSLKASSVETTVAAGEHLAALCDYPLHIGVTEAGTPRLGLIKSAAGIGALLLRGIGDTIRVSLTAPPLEEITAGRDLLKALGLRAGVNVIACPTCGRTKIDLQALVESVEARLQGCTKNLTVAIMGCAVNGPGEAKHADFGLAGGDGCALLFAKGTVLKKVPESEAVDALMLEINKN